MTTVDNRKKLIRLLLPLLAVMVGFLITAVAFLFASFAGGACHCSRPIAVAFPFATILWVSSRLESLGGAVMAFQFPAYALLIALGKTRSARARYLLIAIGIHVVGAVIALVVHRG